MNTLLKKEFPESAGGFRSDPLLHKKKGLRDALPRDILNYKNKVEDKNYMNYAINKIAVELMHFIVK